MKIKSVTGSTVEIFLENRQFVIPPEGIELPSVTAERILKEKPGEFITISSEKKQSGGE